MTEHERLTRLEERFAHLQRHVTEQDKAMRELGEEILRVRKEFAALRAQLANAPEPGATPPPERPPHY